MSAYADAAIFTATGAGPRGAANMPLVGARLACRSSSSLSNPVSHRSPWTSSAVVGYGNPADKTACPPRRANRRGRLCAVASFPALRVSRLRLIDPIFER
jgi:hypothetical protein